MREINGSTGSKGGRETAGASAGGGTRPGGSPGGIDAGPGGAGVDAGPGGAGVAPASGHLVWTGPSGGGGQADPLGAAFAIQRDAALVGFDWGEVEGPLAKLREEILEVEEAIARRAPEEVLEEMGDVLFSLVNLSRLAGVDPTAALEAANAKFLRRFEGVLALARERGLPIPGASLEEMDSLWDEVKRREKR